MTPEHFLSVSKVKFPYRMITGLAFLLAGSTLGYYKSKLQADIENQNYSQKYLLNYISEDQINHTIDKTGKPAVLYYYQPGWFLHHNVRHGFIRSSNLGHQRADFYLINLTKKLQKAIPELNHKFPIKQILMQIRFPKQLCQVTYSDGEKVEKLAYRRQFFNHNYRNSNGVEHFLQQNGLLPAKDPMQDFIKLTKKCLFQPINEQKYQPK